MGNELKEGYVKMAKKIFKYAELTRRAFETVIDAELGDKRKI